MRDNLTRELKKKSKDEIVEKFYELFLVCRSVRKNLLDGNILTATDKINKIVAKMREETPKQGLYRELNRLKDNTSKLEELAKVNINRFQTLKGDLNDTLHGKKTSN